MQYYKTSEIKQDEAKFQSYTDLYDAEHGADTFNGWRVTEQTLEYMKALSKAMPKAKFVPLDITWVYMPTGEPNVRRVNKFAVYMDEFPYALGFVGHGDFSVNGNSKAFMVNSRKIKNTKYSSRRDQYYMQMTTDLKKAVKNASTYLTPYSVKELATLTYRQFAREIERVKDNVEAQRHKLTRPIRDNTNVIVTEMKNLMAQNVKFETEEFKALASSILEALAEQEEERKRKVFGIYVRIRNVGDNTYVDMHKVHDVKTNVHTMRDDGSPPTTVLLSELDAEIAGSVAVLNMLEDGHYVRQVGYKVDATTYWLERV